MAHRETGPHDDVSAVIGGAAAAVRERSRSPRRVTLAERPRIINVMGNEFVVESNVISCPLCRLEFPSHRALCGHMNAHRNRGWRGMNPPPGVRIQDFTEYNDDEVDQKEKDNAVPEEENNEVDIPAEDAAVQEAEENVMRVEVPLIPDLNKSPPPEDIEQE